MYAHLQNKIHELSSKQIRYLSSSGKHIKLKKLEKRESLTFLEKVGIFLPNSSEIDVNELRNRMSPTTHNTLDNCLI